MPTVIVNDEAMEARMGERLLDVARRNAAHIGFVCGGNGICQTCQCRVLTGGEQLSPPTAAERAWFPQSRLDAGHRLACQAAVRGPGPVRVIAKAEELRRQFMDIVAPPEDRPSTDYLEPFAENVVRMTVDQLRGYPFNWIDRMAQIGPVRFLFPWSQPERLFDDATRVTDRMLDDRPRSPAATRVPVDPVTGEPVAPAATSRSAAATSDPATDPFTDPHQDPPVTGPGEQI